MPLMMMLKYVTNYIDISIYRYNLKVNIRGNRLNSILVLIVCIIND